MSYHPEGWAGLSKDLAEQRDTLDRMEYMLGNLINAAGEAVLPRTDAGSDLDNALVAELRHQKSLLDGKLAFIDDMAKDDPLSEKAVAYSNALWAEAAAGISNQAIQHLVQEAQAAGRPLPQAGIDAIKVTRDFHLEDRRQKLAAASTSRRTVDPTTLGLPGKLKFFYNGLKNHPASQAKTATVDLLTRAFKKAGLSTAKIEELTGKDNLSAARRQALNANRDWAPTAARWSCIGTA